MIETFRTRGHEFTRLQAEILIGLVARPGQTAQELGLLAGHPALLLLTSSWQKPTGAVFRVTNFGRDVAKDLEDTLKAEDEHERVVTTNTLSDDDLVDAEVLDDSELAATELSEVDARREVAEEDPTPKGRGG